MPSPFVSGSVLSEEKKQKYSPHTEKRPSPFFAMSSCMAMESPREMLFS